MAILVTGGTGFLGRHLTRHLIANGEKDVVVLDAVPNMAAIADAASQVKVVPGDVMEVTALIDTIKKYKVEGIIHLAYFLGTGGIRNPLPSVYVSYSKTRFSNNMTQRNFFAQRTPARCRRSDATTRRDQRRKTDRQRHRTRCMVPGACLMNISRAITRRRMVLTRSAFDQPRCLAWDVGSDVGQSQTIFMVSLGISASGKTGGDATKRASFSDGCMQLMLLRCLLTMRRILPTASSI